MQRSYLDDVYEVFQYEVLKVEEFPDPSTRYNVYRIVVRFTDLEAVASVEVRLPPGVPLTFRDVLNAIMDISSKRVSTSRIRSVRDLTGGDEI